MRDGGVTVALTGTGCITSRGGIVATIGGRAVAKESGVGLPGLLSTNLDLDPGAKAEESMPDVTAVNPGTAAGYGGPNVTEGDQLGSVLTNADGVFQPRLRGHRLWVLVKAGVRPPSPLANDDEPADNVAARLMCGGRPSVSRDHDLLPRYDTA